ncbi:MAG: hypothetical protein ABI910_05620 [Gemmatimonadota bacterium]
MFPEPAAAGSVVEIFLDDATTPFATHVPPARFELDTTRLDDGAHMLRFVARDGSGKRGVRAVRFTVRNGPGIAIDGIEEGDVVDGRVSLLVNAYGAGYEELWEPARAETPAPIPTVTWVLMLVIGAWSLYYLVRHWSPEGGAASFGAAGPHAMGHQVGTLDVLVVAGALVLVLVVFAMGTLYLLRPGEEEADHIKRQILE